MTSSPKPAKSFMRAIDRLKKAANLEATKKEVTLSDGTIFEMWVTPLTMAERERAQKGPKGDDANEFALRLLIAKACDENGSRLFNAGEIDILKNEVRDADLQSRQRSHAPVLERCLHQRHLDWLCRWLLQ